MATNVEGWGGQEGKITYTHHHDEHMGAMGHHLGFRPLGAALWLEVDLAQLGGARGRSANFGTSFTRIVKVPRTARLGGFVWRHPTKCDSPLKQLVPHREFYLRP